MYKNLDESRQTYVKCLPFFNISPIYEKLPLFLDYPFFRESGYERGIRFGREWRGEGYKHCKH